MTAANASSWRISIAQAFVFFASCCVKHANDKFYCLQNITLVEKDGNFNVVDGQQRLTTLTLLLSYFNEFTLVKNKINYSVREASNKFLQQITSNENEIVNKVLESHSFEAFSEGTNYDYQDVYFMFTALRTIDNWFVENNIDKNTFKTKLLNNVKLIVNRISGIEEQELFMNLNAGRVHLDGSDLIRAILITRVAREEAKTSLEEWEDAIAKISADREAQSAQTAKNLGNALTDNATMAQDFYNQLVAGGMEQGRAEALKREAMVIMANQTRDVLNGGTAQTRIDALTGSNTSKDWMDNILKLQSKPGSVSTPKTPSIQAPNININTPNVPSSNPKTVTYKIDFGGKSLELAGDPSQQNLMNDFLSELEQLNRAR